MTKWQNGLLLTIDFPNDSIVAFDEHGAQVLRTKIQLPNTVRVAINDLTASTTGELAVAVSAFAADGASASYILWLDSHGATQRSVRTTPFASMRIGFGPDGTLWALGREHDADHQDVPGHNILRHFDSAGTLLSSSLPVTAFAQSEHLPHPGLSSFFTVIPAGVGIYAPTTREWVEVSPAGNVTGRWPGPPGTDVNGVAVTDSGHVYLSGTVRAQTARDTQNVLFRLEKANGAWVPVSAGASRFILGAEADKLITRGACPLVSWYQAE